MPQWSIRRTNRNNRRAKIKLLAKKSIETGEDCDSIPESMRQYLAIQAMESGKSMGGNFLGRGGLMPYGSGSMMMGGDQGPQGKVGEYSGNRVSSIYTCLQLTSDSSSLMSVVKRWIVEASWAKRHGLDHLLLTRQGVHDILYQQ